MTAEKGKLTLKGLGYGFLNDVSDTSAAGGVDRQRSNGLDFLNSAISSQYSRSALEKVTAFKGVVIGSAEKFAGASRSTEDLLAGYAKQGIAADVADWISSFFGQTMVTAYKVYIPEIECRPAPRSFEDPIITTYYDVYVDKGMLVRTEAIAVGSIVTVRFDNINNFSTARIIGVSKETFEFEGFEKASLEAAHSRASGRAGSGTSGTTYPAGQPPTPCTSEGSVIYLGDDQHASSNTFGGQLRKVLKDKEVPFVIDMAIPRSGLVTSTSKGFLKLKLKNELKSKLDSAKPKHAIVGLGANDAGVEEWTAETWKVKADTFINTLKTGGVEKIIWIGITKPMVPDEKLNNDGYGVAGPSTGTAPESTIAPVSDEVDSGQTLTIRYNVTKDPVVVFMFPGKDGWGDLGKGYKYIKNSIGNPDPRYGESDGDFGIPLATPNNLILVIHKNQNGKLEDMKAAADTALSDHGTAAEYRLGGWSLGAKGLKKALTDPLSSTLNFSQVYYMDPLPGPLRNKTHLPNTKLLYHEGNWDSANKQPLIDLHAELVSAGHSATKLENRPTPNERGHAKIMRVALQELLTTTAAAPQTVSPSALDNMRDIQKEVLASFPEVTYIDSMQYTQNLNTSDGYHYNDPEHKTWFNAAMAGDLKVPIEEMTKKIKEEYAACKKKVEEDRKKATYSPKDPGNCEWSNGRMQSQKHVWNTTDPKWSKWNGLKVLNGSLESTGIVAFNPAITSGGLLPPVMEDFLKLKEAFDKKFPEQTLNGSGYRTYIGQVNVRMLRAGPGNPCGSGKKLHGTGRDIGVAARPGTSRHGWGAAVDLNRTKWLNGSTVNYTPKGWKAPCYLIEGAGYVDDWNEFWEATDWAYWESRQDRRCQNCKMHSGFEHSAVSDAMKTFKGTVQLAAWSLGG